MTPFMLCHAAMLAVDRGVVTPALEDAAKVLGFVADGIADSITRQNLSYGSFHVDLVLVMGGCIIAGLGGTVEPLFQARQIGVCTVCLDPGLASVSVVAEGFVHVADVE